MTEAPALPLHKRELNRAHRPLLAERDRGRPTTWSSASSKPVEILAPDGYCADLLLEYVTPLFRLGLSLAILAIANPELAACAY